MLPSKSLRLLCVVLSIRLTNDSRAELACASPLQRRAIDADDLELALHYKNATTVLLQRAELLADAGEHTCDYERFRIRPNSAGVVRAGGGGEGAGVASTAALLKRRFGQSRM